MSASLSESDRIAALRQRTLWASGHSIYYSFPLGNTLLPLYAGLGQPSTEIAVKDWRHGDTKQSQRQPDFTVEAVAIYGLSIPPTILARADEVIE